MSGNVGGVRKDTYVEADTKTARALTFDMLSEIYGNQIDLRDECAARLEACTAKFQNKKSFSLMNYLFTFLLKFK
ncbi:MAG: hypothetical protein KAR42_15140 [candidate division Zixibacteria bacterium]|nr:hypothetical protein [candidate division Zixibacteria bacterium]